MLRNRSVSGACVLGATFLAIGSVGCGGAPDANETQTSSALAANALSANALSANALSANALSANALTSNALSANALSANALTSSALRDPLSREFLKYVVSCALDDGQDFSVVVDGVKYTFEGSLGLAPEWGKKNGSCDGSCQRWVSACVLARVDFLGVKREISLRGDNGVLHPAPHELRDYPVREASYFGNVFIPGRPRYLCLSPGQDEDVRVCGPSLDNCPMTVVGDCDDACDRGPFRSFTDCSDKGKEGKGRTYAESITVFLPR
jgi:hypothetical protein